jgi:hypothetical protein
LEIEDCLASLVGRSVKDVTFGVGWFVQVHFEFPSEIPCFLWVEQAVWRVVLQDEIVASCIYVHGDDFNNELHEMLVGRNVVSASVVPRADLVLVLDDGSVFEVWAATTESRSEWSLFLPTGVIAPSEEGFTWEPDRDA